MSKFRCIGRLWTHLPTLYGEEEIRRGTPADPDLDGDYSDFTVSIMLPASFVSITEKKIFVHQNKPKLARKDEKCDEHDSSTYDLFWTTKSSSPGKTDVGA